MSVTIGSSTRARTLLVVASNADTQTVILEHAKAQGHSVISAATPELGAETFDMTQPDIVIIDLFPPEQEGIGLVRQIHERRPSCPVVLLTDAGHGESTMAGLRAGALDYVEQPIHEQTLALVLQRAIHSLAATVEEAPGIDRLESVLVMGCDPNYVESTVTWLVQGTAMGLAEAKQLHLRAALQELIMNAVEHGSLELEYHDKMDSIVNDRYDELIQERQQDPRLSARLVTIRAIYDKRQRRLTYKIVDEGKGFDWHSHVKSGLDVCPPGDASGRGIFLVKSFFPDLTYNERGNEVTFTVSLG
ncbi:MAG: response regulator [Nitrospira sp.]|nr:response regulator [Nitrospira sp.]